VKFLLVLVLCFSCGCGLIRGGLKYEGTKLATKVANETIDKRLGQLAKEWGAWLLLMLFGGRSVYKKLNGKKKRSKTDDSR